MGSDRYMESRMIAENNYWPARRLLEDAEKFLSDDQWSIARGNALLKEIRSFLDRTEQR